MTILLASTLLALLSQSHAPSVLQRTSGRGENLYGISDSEGNIYTGEVFKGEVLRRIISSHRSNRRERTIYEKAIKRAQATESRPG